MLNHSIRLSNHQAVVDEKALFCCMFGHHVTGPKTIPPLALGATHLHLPRSAKICQDLPSIGAGAAGTSREITLMGMS
jgi:hypothetical protein